MSSELVTTLAELFGASEALIRRSAEARAAAQSSTLEAVLTAWTGGSPAPAVPPTSPPVDEPAVNVDKDQVEEPIEDAPPDPPPFPPEPEEPAAEPEPIEEPIVAPEPAPAGSLGSLLLGALVIFAVMFVVSVIAPNSTENAQTLDAVETILLSSQAEAGRDVYLAEGCAFCHTQQVRPIVTDADLGVVTLSDSPLIPGIQRSGPDLAHVGARQPTDEASWLETYLDDPHSVVSGSNHASFGYLTDADTGRLIAYLLESK